MSTDEMTSNEYEQLVKNLVTLLSEACTMLGTGRVRGGATNRIIGASGFAHQIDVSLELPTHLVLIECKYWSRAVGAEAVLTLASRLQDIRAATSKDVSASLVSDFGITGGAETLAGYFGVQIDLVAGFDEYALTLLNRHFVSLRDQFTITDSVIADVVKTGDS
jgi:hypothetical protein